MRWFAHVKKAGQRGHIAKRPVHAECRVRRAPAPLRGVGAVGRLQPVERTAQGCGRLLCTRCGLAPPGVVALQNALQRRPVVAFAISGGEPRLANARHDQATRQLVGPRGKHQGRCLARIHHAVKALELLSRSRCQRVR